MCGVNDVTPQGLYYKQSGRVPVKGLVLAIVGGGAVVSLFAAVYAYFDAIMPFIYLNLIAAVVVGTVAGIVTGKLLVRGIVRNNLAAVIAGAAVGFIALYVAWAAWPGALLDKRAGAEMGFFHLLASPPALLSTITTINRRGAWRLGNATPTGLILWIAWAGEAAIIIGTSLFTARSFVATEAVCETCQQWCVEEPRVLEAHGADTVELKRRLETKDFGYLAALGPRSSHDVEWFRIDLHRCPRCGNTAMLTAKSVDLTTEGGRDKTKIIVEKLLVTQAEVETLRQING